MSSARTTFGVACATGSLMLLAACGGGSMSGSSPPTVGYTATYLVANTATVKSTYSATYTDSNLVNPWGIAFNPQAYVWVANQGTSTTTLYNGNGVAYSAYSGGPLALSIVKGSSGTAGPTGIVYNSSLTSGSNAFVLADGSAATFLFATLGGTIEGWNSSSTSSVVIAYDGGASGAVYTGLAIGADSSGNYYLYAADFSNGTVDVFDHGFAKITFAGGFTDSAIPAGFAPYGIQNIPSSTGAAQIYVTYAQQNAAKNAAVTGAGLGYVAVFDAAGTLSATLISAGPLNAPWGVTMAPSSFGSLSDTLLVGNFGDGKINAFNPSNGASMGALTLANGTTFSTGLGLWGIAFGNGINSQPATTLFCAAGVNNHADSVYGRIDYGATSSGG